MNLERHKIDVAVEKSHTLTVEPGMAVASDNFSLPLEGWGPATRYIAMVATSENPTIISAGAIITTFASNEELQGKIRGLESRISVLEDQVTTIKQALSSYRDEKVIMLRTLTREQAKTEILDLFRQGKPLFYSDIAEALQLDLQSVVEISEELIAEGEVTKRDSRG
jgi:hypothetical protein